MKSWTRLIAPLVAFAIMTSNLFAQDAPDLLRSKDDKSQEIVIRKKGNKADKMTIVVDGDKVTINGKPVDEFKNSDVSVFRRDRLLAPPSVRSFSGPRTPSDFQEFELVTPPPPPAPPVNKAMLGVMTKKSDDGVRVSDVTKESGAAKAGLQKDDIITKVGDKDVKEPSDLIDAIGKYNPNDKVTITYKRNGKENKTTAVLSANKPRAYTYNFNNDDFNFNMPEGVVPPMENFNFNWNRRPKIGLQIQDVEEGKGVKVKDVDEDSPASKAGLKDGDIITQLNGKDLDGVDELRNATRELKEGESVKLTYKRDGKIQNAEVKIPKRLKTADL